MYYLLLSVVDIYEILQVFMGKLVFFFLIFSRFICVDSFHCRPTIHCVHPAYGEHLGFCVLLLGAMPREHFGVCELGLPGKRA